MLAASLMTGQAMSGLDDTVENYPKLSVCTLTLLILIGAGLLRAAVNHHQAGKPGEAITTLPASELDPAFQQKLAGRMRGPYERARQVRW
jgi:hypothetical protein